MSTFYVYALVRPTHIKGKRSKDPKAGCVFYVGKGAKRRVWAHESEARNGCQCHKCNVIRKIWRQGGELQRYFLLTTDDEQEALDYEKEMIALYGRENLCNQTDGGEGVSGYKSPPDTQVRRIAALRLRRQTPESRAKTSARTKEWLTRLREEDPEKFAAMYQKMANTQKGRPKPSTAAFHKGRKRSAETCERLRQINLGRKHSEETRRRMSEAQSAIADIKRSHSLGRIHSKETRQKMSEAHKALASIHRARMLGRKHSEETKRKMSLARKGKPKIVKAWIVQSPDNAIHTITNMQMWCSEQGFSYHGFLREIRGDRPSRKYHGWKLLGRGNAKALTSDA